MTPHRLRWFGRMIKKVLYWVAVVVVSLAILVALILFFESRDDSTLDAGAGVVRLFLGWRLPI